MQDLNTFYMVLDYIEGPSWKDWLRNLKRWPQQGELDQLLFPLLEALEVVHAKQLLHRDIAPKNIMLAKPFTPILIDFGAARQLVAQRSQTFAALLTPGYAPFEQYVATGAGQGPWTDLYGLAATLYESIAGRTPPDAPERALEDKIVPAVEVGGQHYRRDFLEAIDWALKPLPKQRPQSVEEWRWKLLEHQQQLTTTAPQRGSLAAPGTAAETAKRAATPNWSWSRVSQWWTGKEPGKS
jgi:serine/threonine protein kinase